MSRVRWEVVVSAEARRDLASISAWTARNFGERQATTYRTTLVSAIRALNAGPTLLGVRNWEHIGPGFLALPVARGGRRGRHVLVFRVASPPTIDVVRILHDAMDPTLHLGD